MGIIETKVGMRAILRKHNSDMPDDVFDNFMSTNSDKRNLYYDWLHKKVLSEKKNVLP